MPSDPSLSKKAYQEEAERAGLKKDGHAASGEIRVSTQNFIRTGLHSVVQTYGLVAGQLEKLPQAQRMGILAVAAFILFWPLFGVVMVVPWIFGGFILAYSLLLGFETLVNHTEEALLNELTLSPAVIPIMYFHNLITSVVECWTGKGSLQGPP
jgi:ABC-type multidrug transport system permease subunit